MKKNTHTGLVLLLLVLIAVGSFFVVRSVVSRPLTNPALGRTSPVISGSPDSLPKLSVLIPALYSYASFSATLNDTLAGTGPYTVFVATGSGELKNFVISGLFPAADFESVNINKTVDNQEFNLTTRTGKWLINNTYKIVELDIPAENGILHVISE